jgi:hypothetical protein
MRVAARHDMVRQAWRTMTTSDLVRFGWAMHGQARFDTAR